MQGKSSHHLPRTKKKSAHRFLLTTTSAVRRLPDLPTNAQETAAGRATLPQALTFVSACGRVSEGNFSVNYVTNSVSASPTPDR